MGRDPAHRAASAGFPPQDGTKNLGETTLMSGGWDPGIPPVGGSYAGSKFGVNGDLHLQAPKYGCKIHCDTTYYGPFPGGVAEARIAGCQEVVGSGGTRFSGSAGVG